jgi:ubiquinone/menaquinone biosynthesis C-methylase UbiE
MVGGQGDPGPAAAGFLAAARAAYDGAAAGWDDGPGRMYADLAYELVAAAGPVSGLRVLDLGAGTGAAGAAAVAAGAAQVVAADLAPAMLARCPPGLHPVAADAAALPFADRSFGLVLAAFCLGHLPDVPAGLAQVRRLSEALAISSFAPGWTHPAKPAVDDVLAEFGYRPPDWYQTFKRQTEPRSQDPAWLRAQLAGAGFADVRVRTVPVRTAVATPAELAAWRLGLAHVAPFAAALPAGRRTALRLDAEAALADARVGPLDVSMLILTAA